MTDQSRAPTGRSCGMISSGEDRDLNSWFDSLCQQGAEQLSPVSFRYAQVICQRFHSEPAGRRDALKPLVHKALSELEQSFYTAREEARELSEKLADLHPERAAEALRLQENGDLSALRRLASKLAGPENPDAKATRLIRHLTAKLNTHDIRSEEQSESDLETRLKSQDPASEPAALSPHLADDHQQKRPPRNLKAVSHFQRQRQRELERQRLRHMLSSAPVNAGPLNSHRQVVQALNTMQDLSPAYLRRYLNYMDLVFWLEKASS